MKGLLFGSFDGLHAGHDFLISKAQKRVSDLNIILARDSTIKDLKKRNPRFTFTDRRLSLQSEYPNIHIHEGDAELGTYTKLIEISPDIVFFGYDQSELQHNFEEWMKNNSKSFRIETVAPFKEDKYKSSLIYD